MLGDVVFWLKQRTHGEIAAWERGIPDGPSALACHVNNELVAVGAIVSAISESDAVFFDHFLPGTSFSKVWGCSAAVPIIEKYSAPVREVVVCKKII